MEQTEDTATKQGKGSEPLYIRWICRVIIFLDWLVGRGWWVDRPIRWMNSAYSPLRYASDLYHNLNFFQENGNNWKLSSRWFHHVRMRCIRPLVLHTIKYKVEPPYSMKWKVLAYDTGTCFHWFVSLLIRRFVFIHINYRECTYPTLGLRSNETSCFHLRSPQSKKTLHAASSIAIQTSTLCFRLPLLSS